MGVNTSKPDAPGPLTAAIADELRAVMAVKKVSRPELATRTGIGYRSLQRYLNAERTFNFDVLDQIAEALGTTAPVVTAAADARRKGSPSPSTPSVSDTA